MQRRDGLVDMIDQYLSIGNGDPRPGTNLGTSSRPTERTKLVSDRDARKDDATKPKKEKRSSTEKAVTGAENAAKGFRNFLKGKK